MNELGGVREWSSDLSAKQGRAIVMQVRALLPTQIILRINVMPVIKRKLKPNHPNHDNLVNELVRHLNNEPNLPDTPLIIEEDKHTLINNVHTMYSMKVMVIWDEFASVELKERREIIFEAYEKARGLGIAQSISYFFGVTQEEYKKIEGKILI